MQIDNDNNRQSRDRFLDITFIAVVLTAIFHVLPADHPFGIAFGIFVLSLAAGMITVARIKEQAINRWSYLFLIPAVIAALADALYASHVVQGLAFVVSLGSLAFFAYWSTTSAFSFRRVKEFWPFAFFKETILPFGSLTHYVARIKGDRRLGGVAIGTIIALPFLLIFAALFASADQFFSKSFAGLFHDANLSRYAFQTVRDVVVGLYFLAAGVMMLTRSPEAARPADGTPANDNSPALGQTVYVTFLGLINLLFLVFVGFQFAYFFGGQQFLMSQGITYANYAREGFFQLLFVAGVVFGISWVIYFMTEMRQKWTKILNISLIVETGIIIISAIKRLLLYVDVYGLTLARWWAMYCIILIGLTLLAVGVFALLKFSYSQSSKIAFLGILLVTSLALLMPTESMIAGYNIDRFLSGENLQIDLNYLMNLTSDAIPAQVRFVNAQWPSDRISFPGWSPETQADFIEVVRQKKNFLSNYISNVGLGASLSDHWALDALDTLK